MLLATDVQQQSKRLSCHRTVPQRATATWVATSRCGKVVPIGSTYCICVYLRLVVFSDNKCSKYTENGSSYRIRFVSLFFFFFRTFVILDNASSPGMNEISYTTRLYPPTEQRRSREPLQTSGPIPIGRGTFQGENC